MYGSLYVVDDLDQYKNDAEAYVTQHSLVPRDELLKFNRPRREWKLEELADSLTQLHERSFASGKQLFQIASCVACHRVQDIGQELGPDLTKLDTKLTAKDILQSILAPSEKIDEKYASYVFELESGQVVTGMVLEETNDTVKVIENPLTQSEPRIVARSEIASRSKSDSSIMPKGLLDKLTRDEILDLLGYVLARGTEPATEAGGQHAHGAGH
jgi:putative heme-binding domain-containing protein